MRVQTVLKPRHVSQIQNQFKIKSNSYLKHNLTEVTVISSGDDGWDKLLKSFDYTDFLPWFTGKSISYDNHGRDLARGLDFDSRWKRETMADNGIQGSKAFEGFTGGQHSNDLSLKFFCFNRHSRCGFHKRISSIFATHTFQVQFQHTHAHISTYSFSVSSLNEF